MPKAYSYIRFSSVRQQRGDSVARQTKLSVEYAAKNGLDLDTDLNLSDLGISAFDRSNLNKGALGQFLRLVEESRIPHGSYLLVESLDRLSRDKVMDALHIFMGILKAGITVVTLADEQVYSYEKVNENWSSLIMSIVIMSRANEESAMKSHRIRSSWDAKRKNIGNKRLTKRCPYWLKPTADEKGFEFIPERVEIVRRIFKMSMEGVGGATIVKMFNKEGVPVFSPKSNGWQNSYIEKVFNSVSVYGALQLGSARSGISCNAMQALMSARRVQHRVSWGNAGNPVEIPTPSPRSARNDPVYRLQGGHLSRIPRCSSVPWPSGRRVAPFQGRRFRQREPYVGSCQRQAQ